MPRPTAPQQTIVPSSSNAQLESTPSATSVTGPPSTSVGAFAVGMSDPYALRSPWPVLPFAGLPQQRTSPLWKTTHESSKPSASRATPSEKVQSESQPSSSYSFLSSHSSEASRMPLPHVGEAQ